MTWLSINPDSVSNEVLQTAAYLLSNSHQHSISPDHWDVLEPDELADAFNILDPEVTGVSAPLDEDDE